MAAETEAPPAPPEAPASASSAAGARTEQAITSEAGSVADVAVTSEAGGQSKAGSGQSKAGGGKSKAGGKSKKGGKSKTGGKAGKSSDDAAEAAEGTMSLAAHPRAAQRVAEAKAWGGLVGFMLGGYLSLSTYTPVDAGLRAIAAGIFCYMVVWAAAVFAWRRLVVAELRQAEQDLVAASAAARAAAEMPALPAGQRATAGATP